MRGRLYATPIKINVVKYWLARTGSPAVETAIIISAD
jgi:hypothetical protein